MSVSKHLICLALFILTAACSGYNRPSISNDPATMSADTLCYRYGTGQKNEDIAQEIMIRGLDCAAILRADPLYPVGRRDIDAAHRIGR